MLGNPALSHPALVFWDGTDATKVIDVSDCVSFGFTAEILSDTTADAQFIITAIPPLADNPCLPDTAKAEEILVDNWCAGTKAKQPEQIIIPNGSKKGTICCSALACKPAKFIGLKLDGTGHEKIRICVVLAGKRA